VRFFGDKLKGNKCKTKYKDLIERNEVENINKDNKINKQK
jgi:hypothetical protein